MRTLVASLCLILAPQLAGAQTMSVGKVKVINAGIYQLEIKKSIEPDNLAERSWVRKIRQIEDTTKIPARICVSFGFEYTISGAPVGAEIPIKMITRFPNPGLFNPETGKTTYKSEALISRAIGRMHLRSYTFDKEWELVPGVWTFELWHKDQKLAEQNFTVVAPCLQGCDQPTIPKSECEESQVSVAPTTTYDETRPVQWMRIGPRLPILGEPPDVL